MLETPVVTGPLYSCGRSAHRSAAYCSAVVVEAVWRQACHSGSASVVWCAMPCMTCVQRWVCVFAAGQAAAGPKGSAPPTAALWQQLRGGHPGNRGLSNSVHASMHASGQLLRSECTQQRCWWYHGQGPAAVVAASRVAGGRCACRMLQGVMLSTELSSMYCGRTSVAVHMHQSVWSCTEGWRVAAAWVCGLCCPDGGHASKGQRWRWWWGALPCGSPCCQWLHTPVTRGRSRRSHENGCNVLHLEESF
jgi:hypothetical protein